MSAWDATGDEAVPFLWDQISDQNLLCSFGIKDQKFGSKNEISDEKTYLVTTLTLYLAQHFLQKNGVH